MDPTLLRCKCCRNLAKGANESECCGLLYCEECSKTNIQCPKCDEENVILRPNSFIDKLLESGDNVLTTCWVNQPGFDPAIPLVNERGLTARLGHNGKYYCGQARECCHVFTKLYHDCLCACCAKGDNLRAICGPDSGCNCAPCQKLDLAARGLPKGWLVAPDGTCARWLPEKNRSLVGEFTCGRRYEQVVHNPTQSRSWMDKFAEAVKGSVVEYKIRYCGSGKARCQSCANLYDHIMFGNQYRVLIGLPNIEGIATPDQAVTGQVVPSTSS